MLIDTDPNVVVSAAGYVQKVKEADYRISRCKPTDTQLEGNNCLRNQANSPVADLREKVL